MKLLIISIITLAMLGLVIADTPSLSAEVTDITKEKIITTEKVISIYKVITFEYNYTYIDNSSKEPKEIIITEIRNKTIKTGSYIDYINKTITIKEGITITNNYITKDIIFDKCNVMCKQIGDIVTCDSTRDGNGDGILQSGESGFSFNINKLTWYNLKIKSDSEWFNKLKGCMVRE